MKTMYIECNMGAAGDMLMAALYEICSDKNAFLSTMNDIFAPYNVRIMPETITKCGICGTKMHVKIYGAEEGDALYAMLRSSSTTDASLSEEANSHGAHETHDHVTYASVLDKISRLDLPDDVKAHACEIYRTIGEAEAKVHGTTIENIHFHEVGTIDALIDVVGCALLIHMAAPDRILASPIHVGNGFVKCAHGVLPVPAPATAEILKGVPYYTGSIASELCTPTGAAILKHYVSRFYSMPQMAPDSIGYGMGAKEFEIANCVRIFFGESDIDAGNADVDEAKEAPCDIDESAAYDEVPPDDYVYSISCNVDDMTGESIGLATEIFMAAGALDVYTIPIQMKKSRPGIMITCICSLADKEKFTGLFFLHTSTRGVRYEKFARAKLDSTFETRSTSYGSIRVKKSSGYGIQKEKPEFEDLKSVVLKNECAISLEQVARAIGK